MPSIAGRSGQKHFIQLNLVTKNNYSYVAKLMINFANKRMSFILVKLYNLLMYYQAQYNKTGAHFPHALISDINYIND